MTAAQVPGPTREPFKPPTAKSGASLNELVCTAIARGRRMHDGIVSHGETLRAYARKRAFPV